MIHRRIIILNINNNEKYYLDAFNIYMMLYSEQEKERKMNHKSVIKATEYNSIFVFIYFNAHILSITII